jgi:hypothetical protein
MAYATRVDESAGRVTRRTRVIEVIEVSIDPREVDDHLTEVVIEVNGRVLTRLNYHRAVRLGIIEN